MYQYGRPAEGASAMRFPSRLGAVIVPFAIGFAIAAAAQTPAAGYWCEPLRAYYPRAANCPVAWQAVNPGDPASRPTPPPWVTYDTQYAPYDNYNHKGGE